MPNPTTKQVLLVDDDPVLLETLSALLEDEFECDIAGSARAGIRRIEQNDYAVVVTDYDLGDLTGEQVLRAAVSRGASGILVTGHPDLEEVRRLQREVEFLVLFKPVDPGELITWLRHELTLSSLRQSVRRTTARTDTLLRQQSAEEPEFN